MGVLSKGRQSKMSLGMSVRAASSATTMAIAVSSPNKIVGIKLESIRIEKPNTMVIVV